MENDKMQMDKLDPEFTSELTTLVFKKYSYEMERFQKRIRIVKRQSTFSRFQKLIAFFRTREKLFPSVLLLIGDPGLGKTELARQIYEQSNMKSNTILIDWREECQKHPEWFQKENYNVENFFHIIYGAFRNADLGKHFKDYEKVSQLISEAELKVDQALENMAMQEQAPDYFASLRQLASQTIRTFVGIKTLGPAYPMVPEEFKETADKAIAETIKATVIRLAKSRLNRKEFDVYLNGTDRLVSNLGKGIQRAAKPKPILIVLDNYELVHQADIWIRELIRRSSPFVIWVIISQKIPDLLRNYRHDLNLNRNLIDIEISPLSINEIEEVINEHPKKVRSATTGEIRALYEITHGNPLALRMAMNLWFPGKTDHENGQGKVREILEIWKENLSNFENPVYEQYQIMFDMLDRSSERQLFDMLSFSYYPEPNLINILLRKEDAKIKIEELRYRYPYLFNNKVLVDSAKFWLRDQLVNRISQTDFQLQAKDAAEWWFTRLRDFEDQNSDLAECVRQEKWRFYAVATMYHCFWVDDSSINYIVSNIFQSLILLPKETLFGFVAQVRSSIGPLANIHDPLSEILINFERGIIGASLVDINTILSTFAAKLNQTNENEESNVTSETFIINARRKTLMVKVNPAHTTQALDFLESEESISTERKAAIQVAKVDFHMRHDKLSEAYRALKVAQSLISKSQETMMQLLKSKFVEIGSDALQESTVDLAIMCFEEAISISGENTDLLNKKAQAYNIKGDYESAQKTAQRSIDLNPISGSAYNIKGSALFYSKNFREAIRVYSEGIEVEKTSSMQATLLSNVALAHRMLREFDEAEACYDRALKTEPNSPAAVLGKISLTYQKKPELALQRLQKIAQIIQIIDNNFVDNLLMILHYTTDETAIKVLKDVLQSHVNFSSRLAVAKLHYGIGRHYRNLRDWSQAKVFYQKAIRLMPNFIPAYRDLAIVYHELKSPKEARDALFRAFQLMNIDLVDQYVSEVLLELGKNLPTKRVRRRMTKVTKTIKENQKDEVKLREGGADFILGDYEKARIAFGQALKIVRGRGDEFWPRLGLCVTYMQTNKLSEAAAEAERIVINLPEGSQGFVYHLLAEIYREQSKFEEALETYQKALQDYRSDPFINRVNRSQVLFDFAMCHYEVGNDKKAMELLDETHKFDSQSSIGRLAKIAILTANEEFAEANLELRRLERILDWETKVEQSKAEWRSPDLSETFTTFIMTSTIRPILQGALLIGDKKTISHLFDKLGPSILQLVDINHPIYQLCPINLTDFAVKMATDMTTTKKDEKARIVEFPTEDAS